MRWLRRLLTSNLAFPLAQGSGDRVISQKLEGESRLAQTFVQTTVYVSTKCFEQNKFTLFEKECRGLRENITTSMGEMKK